MESESWSAHVHERARQKKKGRLISIIEIRTRDHAQTSPCLDSARFYSVMLCFAAARSTIGFQLVSWHDLGINMGTQTISLEWRGTLRSVTGLSTFVRILGAVP